MDTILEIARYEFTVQWRQRTFLLGSLIATAIFVFVVFMVSSVFRQQIGAVEQASRMSYSTILLVNLHVQVFIFVLAIIPILSSDTIVRDRTYGIMDLINTTPVRKVQYLAGKVLSCMISAVVVTFLVLLSIGIVWWILVFPVDMPSMLGVWSSLLPVALVQPALIMLLVSKLSSRRDAVIVSVIISAATIFLAAASAYLPDIQPTDYVNVSRPLIMRYLAQFGQVPSDSMMLLTTFVASFGQLSLVFMLITLLSNYRPRVKLAQGERWCPPNLLSLI